jgi:hypothetical protein
MHASAYPFHPSTRAFSGSRRPDPQHRNRGYLQIRLLPDASAERCYGLFRYFNNYFVLLPRMCSQRTGPVTLPERIKYVNRIRSRHLTCSRYTETIPSSHRLLPHGFLDSFLKISTTRFQYFNFDPLTSARHTTTKLSTFQRGPMTKATKFRVYRNVKSSESRCPLAAHRRGRQR